jgi:AP endonuclease-2
VAYFIKFFLFFQAAEAWKSVMKKPPATPFCPGHREPADLKTVKKKGPNCGRQFWCCARGEGKAGDPNTRCEFFKWRK